MDAGDGASRSLLIGGCNVFSPSGDSPTDSSWPSCASTVSRVKAPSLKASAEAGSCSLAGEACPVLPTLFLNLSRAVRKTILQKSRAYQSACSRAPHTITGPKSAMWRYGCLVRRILNLTSIKGQRWLCRTSACASSRSPPLRQASTKLVNPYLTLRTSKPNAR